MSCFIVPGSLDNFSVVAVGVVVVVATSLDNFSVTTTGHRQSFCSK